VALTLKRKTWNDTREKSRASMENNQIGHSPNTQPQTQSTENTSAPKRDQAGEQSKRGGTYIGEEQDRRMKGGRGGRSGERRAHKEVKRKPNGIFVSMSEPSKRKNGLKGTKLNRSIGILEKVCGGRGNKIIMSEQSRCRNQQ